MRSPWKNSRLQDKSKKIHRISLKQLVASESGEVFKNDTNKSFVIVFRTELQENPMAKVGMI